MHMISSEDFAHGHLKLFGLCRNQMQRWDSHVEHPSRAPLNTDHLQETHFQDLDLANFTDFFLGKSFWNLPGLANACMI